jgi:hypothetical protein
MLHAIRNHLAAFATSQPEITMYVGPARNAAMLEVAVINDEAGEAIIHARPTKVPEGNSPMTSSRATRMAEFDRWAKNVDPSDLVTIDTSALKTLGVLASQRDAVEGAIRDAVRGARTARHSWSEIGMMLGVTKQAAQQRYAESVDAT